MRVGGGVAFRAVADGAVVDLADRGDLGGGTGQENLVGQVQLVARQRFFFQGDVQFFADVEHRIACDAVETTARQGRGDQCVLVLDENIFPRSLGNVAAGVEQ